MVRHNLLKIFEQARDGSLLISKFLTLTLDVTLSVEVCFLASLIDEKAVSHGFVSECEVFFMEFELDQSNFAVVSLEGVVLVRF